MNEMEYMEHFKIDCTPAPKNELKHYGIQGQKWGVRRFQYEDGSYTDEGKIRYNRYKGKNNVKEIGKLGKAKNYAKIKENILKRPKASEVLKYSYLFTTDELKNLSTRFSTEDAIRKTIPPKKKSNIAKNVAEILKTLGPDLTKNFNPIIKTIVDSMFNIPNNNNKNNNKNNKNNNNKNKDAGETISNIIDSITKETRTDDNDNNNKPVVYYFS